MTSSSTAPVVPAASAAPAAPLALSITVAADGVAGAAASATLPARLPVQLTSFVGREREIAAVRRLLGSTRLLTLTGAGGSGKTRLALEVAARVAGDYAHGVEWVELAPLADPALLAAEVAKQLGLREEPGRDPEQALAEHLEPRSLLLVLDNCEHLIDACATLADALLRRCPRLALLASSREALGVAGETAWLVPPLSLPDDAQELSPERLAACEAVQLFADRARSVLPTFTIDEANGAAIAQICRRLDGIPLAIELAAARVRVISPEQIARRLDDVFRLLSSGSRTALPRHRTLRATLDWSFQLLSEAEQRLLQRLSVFSGGFTIDAAELVCADDLIASSEVLDLLSALVDKSLVTMQEQGGAARCLLLETVRLYAREHLQQTGEEELFQHRQMECFVALAEAAEPHLTGPDQGGWLIRLEREHDNLQTAFKRALEGSDVDLAARLAGALWTFWYQRGHFQEGRQWLREVLSSEGLSPHSRAEMLFNAGALAWQLRDFAAAEPLWEQSLSLWRDLADDPGIARTLNGLGTAAMERGDHLRAEALYQESAALYRRTGDPRGTAVVLSNLASLAVERREFERAESIYRQGLALAREADNPARASNVLLGLGHLSYLRGELGPAVTHLRETLRLAREIGYTHMAVYALAILAEVATAAGDYERAALLFGAVEARFAAMDTHLFPKDREEYDRNRAIASAQLGEVSWEQAWQAGQAMRFDTVVDYALGAGGESSPAAPSGVAMRAGTEVRAPLAPVAAEATAPAPPASWPVAGLAAPAEAPPLRVRALGPLEIEREGEPLGPEALSYAKPRELLLYLLVHPAGRTRQQIALDLWPEASAAQAKNSFHVTLHHLRKGLGRPEWVLFAEERYCIAPAARAEFDALLFEEQVTAALRDLRAGAGSAARLRTALSLYRGDLLQEEVVGDWHLELRDRLRRLYVDGLSAFGELLMEDGAFAEAASVYQQIVRLEDLHEEAHRQLLLCLARSGERMRALRHYERLVALLREELDTAPDAATTELYERLRGAEPV